MQQVQLIQGRLIGPADLALIRAWLTAHPSGNRTRLSRELCSIWGWRNHTGRLKDMAARSLLLQLEARGQIRLPPRRTASVNSARNRTLAPVPHEQSPIHCELAALRPLQLQALSDQSADLALFKFLLQRYHYLGLRNGVGENFKYLARDSSGRLLACLLFGSAAWHVRPRDAWIGWNQEQRRRHLFQQFSLWPQPASRRGTRVWSPGFSRWSCRPVEQVEIFRSHPVCERPAA